MQQILIHQNMVKKSDVVKLDVNKLKNVQVM